MTHPQKHAREGPRDQLPQRSPSPARLGKEFKEVTTTSSTARGTESGSTKRRKREGG